MPRPHGTGSHGTRSHSPGSHSTGSHSTGADGAGAAGTGADGTGAGGTGLDTVAAVSATSASGDVRAASAESDPDVTSSAWACHTAHAAATLP